MFPVFLCSVIVCSYYILLNFYFQLIPPISFIILLQERSIPWVFIYALWEIWIAKLSKMIFYLLIWTWAPLPKISAHTMSLYLETGCLPYIQHLFNSIWALVWILFSKHQITRNHPSYLLVNPVITAYWLRVLYPAYTNPYNPLTVCSITNHER